MTKHEQSHPRDAIPDHPQEEIKGIRERSSQKKKWPKPHAFTMLRASATVVTNVTTSMRTKPQQDSPKRTNSPAPKKGKKGKDSNAAPCLIDRCQKYACIAKTKPKATSSLVNGEPVSMKRIRFRKSVHFIEVPAVGEQRPVRHRPREYSRVYRTSIVTNIHLEDKNFPKFPFSHLELFV